MLPYKERGSNIDKCLSLYLDITYQEHIKYPKKYPHLYIKWGSKCKTAFNLLVFTIAFNFGYVCFVNCGLKKYMH